MFWNWFKQKAHQVRNIFNTSVNISKNNKPPEKSPEIMRVVAKFASIFMDADISVQNNDDVIDEAKTVELNKLLGSDPLYKGKSSFLSKLCKVSMLQGGAILKKVVINGTLRTLDLLEPETITATVNYNESRLTVSNYRELFKRFQYNDYYTGKVINLQGDDLNIFVDNLQSGQLSDYNSAANDLFLVSRLSEIQDKINNSFYANNMLSSLMNRCSIVFLSRENKSEYTTISTSGDAKQRTKDFNDAYHINNSAVVPIGDNMKVLDTSISVKDTGVFDSFEDTISAACNLLGITRTIIEIQGSTFSNQQGAIKDAIQNGVQSFADKVADFLTDMLKEHRAIESNQHVVFDYTEVLARNLADSPDQLEQPSGTPGADPNEINA